GVGAGVRVLILFLVLGVALAGWESRRYSVMEETESGSSVANLAKDLGLGVGELAARGARVVSEDNEPRLQLDLRTGELILNEKLDREEMCGPTEPCVMHFQVLLKKPLGVFRAELLVRDINDHSPEFPEGEMTLKISENSPPGTVFPLKKAQDLDVGNNNIQNYSISPNSHFHVSTRTRGDGRKYPELVLDKELDREKQAELRLTLTALDGGSPPRSGTAQVRILVLDVNDNAPEFAKTLYQVQVPENKNVPLGTRLLTVKATDPDEGVNGEVTYSFHNIDHKIAQIFQLDSYTGEISNKEALDFEEYKIYSMEIQAQDGAGLMARAKVLVKVLDINDNAPEVTMTSVTTSVPENFPPGAIIALISVHDQDSGGNGETTCSIPGNLPFKLEKLDDNYYHLVTERTLDRELTSRYNITVTATDQGIPALSTETHISLQVTDINDNPPVFPQDSYSTFIPENNPRGASLFSATAHDADSNENAQVTYSLVEDTIQGAPLTSYVSINSDTGVLYALQSFDYEQLQDLQLRVMACDSGDPPLSSNVSLSLFVLDQNDNAPEVLYPALPTDGSTGVELAPRSAEPGYLVTKVVAVDRDSGQNAWLSYRLLKASEPGLFAVGLHTGEVRTARALLDRDALKQSLVVAVQDHGQPPLSATVTLTVAVADSIPDVLADLGSIRTPGDPDDSDLTLYLVVAVAAVSCVFLAFVIVLLALRLRRWHASRQEAGWWACPASHFVGVDGVRAFLQTYSHEVSLTADSRESHVIFPQPNDADTLISQESCGKSEPLLITQDLLEDKKETFSQVNFLKIYLGIIIIAFS
uniref:Protocadherin gamma-A1-like n=1 Tax=Ursus maritimus TaxID=29073 RepID=A0A452U9I2_URSMA